MDKLERIKSQFVGEKDIDWLIEQADKLTEAQTLIKKIYDFSGSNADTDYMLWKETEKYCKNKGLV